MSDGYGEDRVRHVGAPAEKYEEVEARRGGTEGFGFLSLEDFDSGQRETTVELDLSNGRVGICKVTYEPNLMTDALTDQIQQLADDGDTLAAAEVFCQVVKAWGFTGPLTAQIIATDATGKVVRDETTGEPLWKRDLIVPAGETVPVRPQVIQYMRSDVIIGIWRKLNEEMNGGKSKKSQKRLRRR